jgi:hypothetical protein
MDLHACRFLPPASRTASGDAGNPEKRPTHDRSDRGGLGVNIPLLVAGSLAILGTAVHGAGGEILVRKLLPETLPSSPFGGPRMTRSMLHVTWHTTTIAYLTVGSALILSGSVVNGDTARGMSLLAAGASTGFAALTVGLGAAHTRSPRSARSLFLHPGPAALTATAALAWWGAL